MLAVSLDLRGGMPLPFSPCALFVFASPAAAGCILPNRLYNRFAAQPLEDVADVTQLGTQCAKGKLGCTTLRL